MNRSVPEFLRAAAFALLLAGPAACGDEATGPEGPGPAVELGVVLNSVDVSLTVFDAAEPAAGEPATIGLGPAGTPVGLAVRDGVAAVPLGLISAVAVVDLAAGAVAATYPLPDGSGATGVAFVNDTLLVVANPGRNTVSPVNLRTGTVGDEIDVGLYPQAVLAGGGRVVVVNSALGPDFMPAGPGTLTVLDAGTLAVEGHVQLTGENPGGATFGPGGRIYVVNSGRSGEGDGSLSVVDLDAAVEVARHAGFGDFPFAIQAGPDGLLYVGAFSYGIAVWDPAAEAFVRGPDDAVEPAGVPSTSGLAFDPAGRLHALLPECQGPGRVLRLGADFDVEEEVAVGTCPTAVAFTAAPSGE